MNIWLIDHYTNTPSDPGDARHYSNARELIGRGHQVRVIKCSFNHLTRAHVSITPDSKWQNKDYGGVPFTVISAQPYNGNFEVARIVNMFQFAFRTWRADWAKELPRPDLILGSAPDPFVALAAERLASRYGVPFLLEIRDAWPYAIAEVTGRSRRHPFVVLVDWTMRYLYRKAEKIIMLSQSSTLLAEWGADPGKLVWIPHGVDLRLNPVPQPPPKDNFFTITYLGAHNPWNSLDTILDAAKLIAAAGADNIRFRFVGDGTSKPALLARVKAEHLTNVVFDPSIGKDRVHEVLSASDAFILNNRIDGVSKKWMSFNKLYDYLAAGRPIIFGSVAEHDPVREAGAGITIPAGDAHAIASAAIFLAELPEEELRAYGGRGRRYIEERFTIPVLTDQFEAIAHELVTRTQPPLEGSHPSPIVPSPRTVTRENT